MATASPWRRRTTRACLVRGPARSAAAALVLAACGPAGTGGAPAAATTKPVTLVFEWPTYTPPKQEWAEHAMKTYAQKFPHVTIEPMWNTNPTEKLTTTLAGGA